MITKLDKYTSSPDGVYLINHPNTDDLMNKMNEIIDYINREEEQKLALIEYYKKLKGEQL